MKKEKADLELLKLTIESREFKIKTLIEENDYWRWEAKKLKEELAYERTMLDNVRAEYKSLQNVIKNLKEKVRFLEECLDRKEKLNEEYRKEIKGLKSDLWECECSFWFENDEVWFWKREYKRLKKRIKDHCKWYWNLFPEDEMKRQWKKADKKRKLKSTHVYDAKQVRDIC